MADTPTKAPANALYEADFYNWTQEQARLLEQRRWDELDLENLVEEVQSIGRRDQKEIEEHLTILMAHLLKWKYQPGRRGEAWSQTIWQRRSWIEMVLEDSPSLREFPAKVYQRLYLEATLLAEKETGIAIDLFPDDCPFSLEQIMDEEFLPKEPGYLGPL